MQGATQTTSVIPNANTPPDDGSTSPEEDKIKESSFSESSSEDDENEDPEMAALLRENSASGSSDDDDIANPTLKLSEIPTRQMRKKGLLNRYDSPTSNIAVLVLTCWMMRIPVTCADFRKSAIHLLNISNLATDVVAGSSSCMNCRISILFHYFLLA